MALENRNLEVGTRLAARYKGRTYTAEVVQTEDGVRYRLEDGREFRSPSAAGSAVMGGVACNGWRFWSLEGGEAPEKAPKARGRGKAKVSRRRKGANGQTATEIDLLQPLEEGRWFCSACQKGFDHAGEEPPTVCPEGHGAGDSELTAVASAEEAPEAVAAEEPGAVEETV